ncbi:MAG: YggS family pyridoxal phosphate-dependent enzyme [Lachnospiraceae bacterium]|nr:YggS family pyridoxal phosphate-dependent enzyme [Lachnospiraceae bacterium]
MDVTENLKKVLSEIEKSESDAGRDPGSVKLIAVSKTKPVEMIQEAYDAGQRDFGENYVQEIVNKSPLLPPDIRWHMIGHLQRNKVRQIIDKVCMIHGVDSLKLAEEISRQAEKREMVMPVLMEVNIGSEESKSGVRPEEVRALAEEMGKLPGISLRGLMCVPPVCEDPGDSREYFRRMQKLSVDIMPENIDNKSVCELSMGMSHDFREAIYCGATMVRIGTDIFGERDYSNKK